MYVILTEHDRRALTRFNEQAMAKRAPLAPRWLRRAIAERLTANIADALASSDPTRSQRAQAIVAQVVGSMAPPQASANPLPQQNLTP